MWPVTSRFLDTLAHDHDRITKVEVLEAGVPIFTMEGAPMLDPNTGRTISTVGGKIDVARSNIRRSGSVDLSFVDGVVTRDDIRDLLVPLRNEIRIYSGVIYWDAVDRAVEREYVPVATLVIEKDTVKWPKVTVSGYDRMWIVQRARFTSMYTVPAGTLTMTAIDSILRDALPESKTSINLPTSDDATGLAIYEEQADRADAVQNLATSAGYVLFVDPMGTFKAVTEPDTSGNTIDAVYIPGVNSTMFRPEREISGGNSYSVVVAKGDSPDSTVAAPRGYAEDTNPNSLTYVGDVGPIPYFYSSPLLTSDWKATLAASTILKRVIGIGDTIVTPIIPNPAHESGDVIYVEDPSQGIATLLIADEFPVPLRATDGAQALSCRTQVFTT